MFVKSVMIPKHKSFTIQKNDTLKMALDVLEKHQVDGIPVLDGNKYVGILTRYSLYENYFLSNQSKEEYLLSNKCFQIATRQDQYLIGEEIFEHTLLELRKFPLLAVVDDNRNFLGVVTRFDVLEQFRSAFGANRPGIRIAFTSVETEGRIARFAEIAHQFREQIISLVTFDETDKLVRRIVMKVEKNDNLDKFIKRLEEAGFRILDIHED
jgi:CBS domain-containing protein